MLLSSTPHTFGTAFAANNCQLWNWWSGRHYMCSKVSCSIEMIFFFDYKIITTKTKMGLKTELVFILTCCNTGKCVYTQVWLQLWNSWDCFHTLEAPTPASHQDRPWGRGLNVTPLCCRGRCDVSTCSPCARGRAPGWIRGFPPACSPAVVFPPRSKTKWSQLESLPSVKLLRLTELVVINHSEEIPYTFKQLLLQRNPKPFYTCWH